MLKNWFSTVGTWKNFLNEKCSSHEKSLSPRGCAEMGLDNVYCISGKPTTFIFGDYDPYILGLNPSFFIVLGSKGTYNTKRWKNGPLSNKGKRLDKYSHGIFWRSHWSILQHPKSTDLNQESVLFCAGFYEVPSRKLTYHWKIHHLKMYFLLNMGMFQCHVSFQECTYISPY